MDRPHITKSLFVPGMRTAKGLAELSQRTRLSKILDAIDADAGDGPGSDSRLWPKHGGLHRGFRATTVHSGGDGWSTLVDFLREEAELAEAEPLSNALRFEAARTLRDRLGRLDDARELIGGETHPLAGELLDPAAGEAGLVSVLERLEGHGNDTQAALPDRVAAWVEFGLAAEFGEQPERAFEGYLHALELQPDHTLARTLAVEAAHVLGDTARATELSEQYSPATAQGPWAGLVALDRAHGLNAEANGANDHATRRALLEQAHALDPSEDTALRLLLTLPDIAPETRLEWTLKLADVAGDEPSVAAVLHDALLEHRRGPNAARVCERIIEEAHDSADPTAWAAALGELALRVLPFECTDADDPLAFVRTLETLGGVLDDPAHDLHVEQQHVLALAREGEPEALDQALDSLLERLPDRRWLHELCCARLEQRKAWSQLGTQLQRWASAERTARRRAATLSRLGRMCEEQQRSFPRAAEAYELALAEDPNAVEVANRLASIYERMRRWPQAMTTYQHLAEVSPTPYLAAAALRRVAALARREVHDADLAIASLQRVAELEPLDLMSHFELAALARAHDRPDVLRATLESLVDRVDESSRASLFVELGELLELRLKQRTEARAYYERALELTPGYTSALRALGRLYRDEGDYDALLEIFSEGADPVTPPALLALKAGRACLEELEDRDRAVGYLRKAYELNPSLRPARDRLLQIYLDRADVKAAYDLLRAHPEQGGLASRADHHYRLGMMAERLAQTGDDTASKQSYGDAALQHYRHALRAYPEHPLAFDRARRLLTGCNDLGNLAALWDDVAQRQTGTRFLVARVSEARAAIAANRVDTAVQHLRDAWQVRDHDPFITREYQGLLSAASRSSSAAGVIMQWARRTEEAGFAAALWLEAAEYLQQSEDAEDRRLGADCVLKALTRDPGNPYAVRQLEELIAASHDLPPSREIVAARAVRAQSENERALFFLESAELLARADLTKQSARSFEAAQAAVPGLSDRVREIWASLSSHAQAEPAAESIHTLMTQAREAALRSGAGTPSDMRDALTALGQVLSRQPEHPDALALCKALVGRMTDASPALALLGATLKNIQAPELRYELGLYLGKHDTERRTRIEHLIAAHQANPSGAEALRALIAAYIEANAPTQAADAAQRLIGVLAPDDPTAADVRLTLAELLASGPPAQQAVALEHARAALEQRPEDARATQLCATLLERSGHIPQAAALLDRLISAEADSVRRHDLLVRKAEMLSARDTDTRGALAAVEAAARLQPQSRETLELLIDMLDRCGERQRIGQYLASIRQAIQGNLARGSVSLRDLRLLARVAAPENRLLADIAKLVLYSIDPSSAPPPGEHMKPASAQGLRTVLGTVSLLRIITGPGEPEALRRLLQAIDPLVDRLGAHFPSVARTRLAPPPERARADAFSRPIQQWISIFGGRAVQFAATEHSDATHVRPGTMPVMVLGNVAWDAQDPAASRGMAALALARYAAGGPRVRALDPEALDLLLAACFDCADVFNPITADPDTHKLRAVSTALSAALSPPQRRAVEAACTSLGGHTFAPGQTARILTQSDLRLGAVVSGDLAGCLGAACLLDDVEGGSLKQRISKSGRALSLMSFFLTDDYLRLRFSAQS